MLRAVACAVAVLVIAGSAQAADDAEARARAHFEAGRGLYRLENYRDALAQFAAGYALVGKPGFLINIAQCHRKLGEVGKAREALERFMREAPEGDPERGQVAGLLTELKKEEEDAAKAGGAGDDRGTGTAAATATATATATGTRTGTGAGTGAGTGTGTGARWTRHLWWIVPVAAVVLAGIATGIYFGVAGRVDCGAYGCIDLRK